MEKYTNLSENFKKWHLVFLTLHLFTLCPWVLCCWASWDMIKSVFKNEILVLLKQLKINELWALITFDD